MTPLFKKLNFKNHKSVLILNFPEVFEEELQAMASLTTMLRNVVGNDSISFALLFVTNEKDVETLFESVYGNLVNDAILWFCYPKGSSKKYQSSISRDKGWSTLGIHGFEPVRLVSINEDWSALRFRKTEHIKTMTRSFPISEEGKRRTAH